MARSPLLNLARYLPQPEALNLIPEEMARKYVVLPLEIADHTLRVAMANPTDIFALEALASQSQLRIETETASAEQIQEAIDFNYKAYDEIEKQVSSIAIPRDTNKQIRFDSVIETPVAQALSLSRWNEGANLSYGQKRQNRSWQRLSDD